MNILPKVAMTMLTTILPLLTIRPRHKEPTGISRPNPTGLPVTQVTPTVPLSITLNLRLKEQAGRDNSQERKGEKETQALPTMMCGIIIVQTKRAMSYAMKKGRLFPATHILLTGDCGVSIPKIKTATSTTKNMISRVNSAVHVILTKTALNAAGPETGTVRHNGTIMRTAAVPLQAFIKEKSAEARKLIKTVIQPLGEYS